MLIFNKIARENSTLACVEAQARFCVSEPAMAGRYPASQENFLQLEQHQIFKLEFEKSIIDLRF